MSASTSRKRARLDSNVGEPEDHSGAHPGSQAGSESTGKRDEEFWYDDGNIILIARDIEFRVYRGLLVENSPVFSDMFSFPQPPVTSSSATAPADNCPTVHLSDSPEDIRHMLRMFMPRSNMSMFMPGSPTFDNISAAVRIGHKYQMPTLLQQAIDYLKKHYTNNFDVWDRYPDYCPSGFRYVHSIGVVNLARLTGETSLLPTALLACCQLDEELIPGFVREDGTSEQLTLSDVGLCFVAKTRFIHESTRFALAILRPTVSGECKTALECGHGFKRLLRRLEGQIGAVVGTDPFQFMPRFDGHVYYAGDLCKHCWAMLRDRNRQERRAIWNRLPDILGIAKPDAGGAGVVDGVAAVAA